MLAKEGQAETDRKGHSRKGYRCLRGRIWIANHQEAETERQREGSKTTIHAADKRCDRAFLLQRRLLFFPLWNTYGFPLRNTFGFCSGNISVEADVLRPRPVEIGDEQISRACEGPIRSFCLLVPPDGAKGQIQLERSTRTYQQKSRG
jgi:hypothetical protein